MSRAKRHNYFRPQRSISSTLRMPLPAPVKLTKREIKRGRETTRHCGQAAGSESQLWRGPWMVRSSLTSEVCQRERQTRTTSRCFLLKAAHQCFLDQRPFKRKRELKPRFQFPRFGEPGHRSVQSKRPLREGLFQDKYFTTSFNIFIYPYYLPLI